MPDLNQFIASPLMLNRLRWIQEFMIKLHVIFAC